MPLPSRDYYRWLGNMKEFYWNKKGECSAPAFVLFA